MSSEGGSLAEVFLLGDSARLTLDLAAPDELAVTLFVDFSHDRLVAAAAAQKPTAVHPVTRVVTRSVHGAQDRDSALEGHSEGKRRQGQL